ncbi:hypothetical protein ALC62_05857 [Cyphomyrmex costatus]|uniref:Uncharacterized protein n=1 Tax=Cyphomyrmex costatus TaxID=456900 RepID=A0A151IJE4_9HYME|nr:hypothetical protein ALC62_05857 [Cyphomyrmex costatus]
MNGMSDHKCYRRGFCEHFRDEHERGVMDVGVADGGARLARVPRVHPRRREAKGHVTGGQERREWGWEEVEVS